VRVKGITVYRYGTRPGQVLTLLTTADARHQPPIQVDTASAGGCGGHLCEF
jgi:ribonucleoside-diphosphate reductase alpha chain